MKEVHQRLLLLHGIAVATADKVLAELRLKQQVTGHTGAAARGCRTGHLEKASHRAWQVADMASHQVTDIDTWIDAKKIHHFHGAGYCMRVFVDHHAHQFVDPGDV